jgi:hypothetical protein
MEGVIHFKTFCKCHNVLSVQQFKEKKLKPIMCNKCTILMRCGDNRRDCECGCHNCIWEILVSFAQSCCKALFQKVK